ncbi:hypothetical protein C5C07_13775 [Haloferax sp. Atlit-4N]|uniref:hypothetical protein n=1 Tax=Haloferax sp. Atlit-4N TaxID=2077206 RepID=UPI000E2896A1|nr:hypothetical protein [Haloferax sp. Atlit-4N]RDZ52823.1 hypothetical protein C5C07_13775 [Haloferax sp. Atlit-4N]
MKRRNVIAAIGTLAIGSGTAIGTGAFNATSTSADSSMSIITERSDVDVDVSPGSGAGSGNIRDSLYSDTEIENIDVDDLPLAAVADNGQGMVHVQIIGVVGTDETFSNIVELTNNDADQSYEMGFYYDGGFTEEVTSGDKLTESEATDVFEFTHDSTVISSLDGTTGGTVELDASGGTNDTVQVSIDFNGTDTRLNEEYGLSAGGFGTGGATQLELIDQVTAFADEV